MRETIWERERESDNEVREREGIASELAGVLLWVSSEKRSRREKRKKQRGESGL